MRILQSLSMALCRDGNDHKFPPSQEEPNSAFSLEHGVSPSINIQPA